FECVYAINGGVFETEIFGGVYVPERALSQQCSLMEATEAEFELSGIGIDIVDGIDTLHARGIVRGIHGYRRFLASQPPVGNRSQLGAQSEQGDERIRFQQRFCFVLTEDAYMA